MPFSNRTPDDLSPNPLSKAFTEHLAQGIIDLTQSNPTRCGFNYPKDLLASLSSPENLAYEPDPLGHPRARRAVAGYLQGKGYEAVEERILLTASTSEAYTYLFKLLGNPGDSFLVPTPSYPLLEHLTRLEAVEALPYRLKMEPGWSVDLADVEARFRSDTKGLVVVDPNNPTGSILSQGDQENLYGFCRKHRISYLSDEVFADFTYSKRPNGSQKSPEGILSFRMGGLSKSLGLPQLKLAWVLMDGPSKLLDECRERLELIADSYLSINTPVQLALSDLFKFAPVIQKEILDRILGNRAVLEKEFVGLKTAKVWPAQGGWYALVERLDAQAGEEEWVLELLKKEGVWVQPGGFYDLASGCFVVLSLLPQPDLFREGVARISRSLEKD